MKFPFYATNQRDRVQIHLRLEHFLLYWPIATLISLIIVISTSCVYTFSCSEFLPTVSYLAAYNGYDRIIVFIVTAQIIPLLIFFMSASVLYFDYYDCIDRFTLKIIGVFTSLALPAVVVMDEVNSSYYFPFDKIHTISLSGVVVALAVWMGFSLEWVWKSHKKTPSPYTKFVIGYVILCLFSLYDSYREWKTAEGPNDYIKLAIKEYITIGLLAFLPRIYCLVLSKVQVSFGQIIKASELDS
ncbi:hypothetical protein SteCoe_13222 [Stentor coeruleus]|uniref:Uncharacterized protein n=1 Tax=Stentor coeruleus TaxID=5963 RepID=A0A1R2C8Y0_9CILI|nr:hypothetical protein SteCoe_13222 [Stentor coeruleus]